MQLTKNVQDRRQSTIHHLNRILGQINTLKEYIAHDRSCADIAQLTTSIAKSFDSLRSKTLEGFILSELIQDKQVSPEKRQMLTEVLKLYQR